jgi:biopolymer transport protein ExbD
MNFQRSSPLQPLGFQIAPLVDVLLVLLLYFILTWNFALTESQLDISVPTAREGRDAQRAVGQMIVNVDQQGNIIVNKRVLRPEELVDILKKLSANFPDQAVVLRGDENANYRAIVRVLDICRDANIWNVAFATSKPKESQ